MLKMSDNTRTRTVIRPVPAKSRGFMGNNQGMLTVRNVAEILNVHPDTVRRWANSGALQGYRVGTRGDHRFLRGDVDRYLDLACSSMRSHRS